ncbi:MAG: triose-phosphate isomerase [Candidatus Amoebophilus sp.]
MHHTIIAANWKMNKNFQEGLQLAKEIIQFIQAEPLAGAQIILFPSFIHLEAISKLLTLDVNLHLGAQNCHEQIAGAFTGEVSAAMLASIDVRYVLVGHSERRQNFAEDNDLIAKKIDAILSCKLQPVFCCGESLSVRESNQHYAFIEQQIAESLFHLTPDELQQIIIAYEPIWAIGTGLVPSLTEIEEMQQTIRNILTKQYNTDLVDNMVILYGGSCNASNVTKLISLSGINGVLIGGASLHFKEFIHILRSL